MNLGETFALLNEEMGAHGLIDLGWTGQLDEAKKRFGVCRLGTKEISISGPLALLNSEDEVRDTILHEIAHALAWETYREGCGHDARWKEICVRIGARPERCYDDEVIQPELPWALCHAETGEVFSTFQRKPARDPAQMWIRGRKEETYGKLGYCLNPRLYPPGELAEFDGNVAREFQAQLMEAARRLGEKWGICPEEMTGKYREDALNLTIRFGLGKGDGRDAAERAFCEYAGLFGLEGSDYGRVFVSCGKEYRLLGLKPRSPKYPVIGEGAGGKRFKFPREVLEDLI